MLHLRPNPSLNTRPYAQPWFTRRRGLAAGIASAGIGAGTLVVPLVAAAAIAQWQWRGAMVVLAAGVAVVGVAHVIIQRSVRERFVRARHNRLTPPATLSGRSR